MRFVFTLAETLGTTVDKLLDDISADELVYWFAKHRIDPMGEVRSDYRNAMLLSLLVNAFSAFGGKRANVKPSDYLLCEQDKPRKSPKHLQNALILAGMFAKAIEKQRQRNG